MKEVDNLDLDKLMFLISKANSEIAAELISYFDKLKIQENNSLPYDKFLNLLREKIKDNKKPLQRFPSLSRVFFEPFSMVFENDGTEKILPGSFERNMLGSIWEVITEICDKEKFDKLGHCIREAILINRMDMAKKYSTELTLHLAEIIDLNGEDVFHNYDNNISREVSVRFARFIKLFRIANLRNVVINSDLENVSVNVYNNIVALFRDLDRDDNDMACEFLLLLMESSQKSWAVMRVIKSALPNITDKELETSKYNILTRRMFVKIERLLKYFSDARLNAFSGYELAEQVEIFNKLTHGLERETVTEINGVWHKIIYEYRARAQVYFIDLCHRAVASIEKVLPVDRTMIKGKGYLDIPRTAQSVDILKLVSAVEYAIFIREVRLFSPLAGFSAARDNAFKEMQKNLDMLKSGLVNVNLQYQKGTYFADWGRAVVNLTREIDDDVTAKAFERRLIA